MQAEYLVDLEDPAVAVRRSDGMSDIKRSVNLVGAGAVSGGAVGCAQACGRDGRALKRALRMKRFRPDRSRGLLVGRSDGVQCFPSSSSRRAKAHASMPMAQRTKADYAALLELHRDLRCRRFVGARAIYDDVAIAREVG